MNHDDERITPADALLIALMTATTRAEHAGDTAAKIVIDALLDAVQEGQTERLAMLIDTHRRPVVTAG